MELSLYLLFCGLSVEAVSSRRKHQTAVIKMWYTDCLSLLPTFPEVLLTRNSLSSSIMSHLIHSKYNTTMVSLNWLIHHRAIWLQMQNKILDGYGPVYMNIMKTNLATAKVNIMDLSLQMVIFKWWSSDHCAPNIGKEKIDKLFCSFAVIFIAQ